MMVSVALNLAPIKAFSVGLKRWSEPRMRVILHAPISLSRLEIRQRDTILSTGSFVDVNKKRRTCVLNRFPEKIVEAFLSFSWLEEDKTKTPNFPSWYVLWIYADACSTSSVTNKRQQP